MNATNIDRYLRTGHTVRQVARFFDIPESVVQFRADRIEERRLSDAARRKLLESAKPVPPSKSIDDMQKWVELDIRYEDDPRSVPFNYGAAIRNTVALRRQTQTGGGISSIYDGMPDGGEAVRNEIRSSVAVMARDDNRRAMRRAA